MKKIIQDSLRYTHKKILQKTFPKKIAIYFHDIYESEIVAIKNLVLYFKSLGYEFKTINDFANTFDSDSKIVSLTFDDGFKNWLKLMPIFEKNDVSATFYLNSIFFTSEDLTRFLKNINLSDKSRLIDKDGVSKLVANGHEIGAHTHTHFTISKLSLNDLVLEDKTNFDYLSKFYDISSFAIPYGMRRYVKKDQLEFLQNKYSTICFGEAGMQFRQTKSFIQRHPWKSDRSFIYNLENLSTDTSYFNNATLRSGLG